MDNCLMKSAYRLQSFVMYFAHSNIVYFGDVPFSIVILWLDEQITRKQIYSRFRVSMKKTMIQYKADVKKIFT